MSKAELKTGLTGLREAAGFSLKSMGQALSSCRIGYQTGLMISGQTLRLCLIKRFLTRNRVIDVASFSLDPERSRNWTEIIESAATVLTGFFKDHGLRRTPVNIGLIGEDTAFRRLYLPHMSLKELAPAVKWEGEKLFPFDLDQCLVYHRLVERGGTDSNSQDGVNIIAFKNVIIEAIYERFHAAGLTVGQIGFLPDFIAPVLHSQKSDVPRRDLVVYLDDEQSMAIFVQNGSLEFFQQFVTRPLVHDDTEASLANLEALSAELISFIDLYNGQNFGNSVQTIYLAGKYGQSPETVAFLSENTGLPCQSLIDEASLPSRLGHPSREQIALYLDAIMTALAEPDEHPLAPKSIQTREANRKLVYRVGAVGALALLTAVNMQLLLGRQEQIRKNELDSKKVIAHLFEKSAGYQGYINLMGKLKREEAYLNHTRDRHDSHFHVLLKEISVLAPEYIGLTAVDLDEKDGQYRLRLDGRVRVTGFSPEIILADYVETLGKSPFFQNVKVSSHNKKREQNYFDLTFQLIMDARV